MGRNEYRYWNPTNHATHNPKNWEHVKGKERKAVLKKFGSLENAEAHYREEDYKRHESANRGDWAQMCLSVTATYGKLSASTSLGGIESDAGKDYRDAMIREQKGCALNRLAELIMARCNVE